MITSIVTPTYNRAYVIENLYNSLIVQSSKDFEWIIIDDGSTDETESIVREWIKEDLIKIIYIKQFNGGKHKAINNAVKYAKSDYVFIVDSDDLLIDNAIERIDYYKRKYSDNRICGFSFLRKNKKNEVIGKKYKSNEYISDYITCRINEKITGDKAEVYKTSVLLEFPFIEFDNENFLSEDYSWIQIAEKYDMVHINEAIYICDYLDDGLTKNLKKKEFENPKGESKRGLILCNKRCNLTTRVKGMMKYISYGLIAKNNLSIEECKYKCLFLILLIPSTLYYLILLLGAPKYEY